MSAYDANSERAAIQTDPAELLAGQEDFYLEQIEEDLRMILECGETTTHSGGSSLPVLENTVEDLVTVDSDDPPLSEAQVTEFVRQC